MDNYITGKKVLQSQYKLSMSNKIILMRKKENNGGKR